MFNNDPKMQSPTSTAGFSENVQSNTAMTDDDEVRELKPLDFTNGSDVDYFRTQMTEILLKLNLSPNNVDRMLSTETLNTTWLPGFTHSSITNRDGQNYETLEAHGDKFLGAAMLEYMRRMYTKDGLFVVPPGKITTAVNTYMAETHQIQFAKRLGLDNLISFSPKLTYDTNSKILEDVFEAFAACIYIALTDNVGMSVGFDGVFNLIKYILSDIDFDVYSGDTQDPVTRLKEMWMDMDPANTGTYTYYNGESKLVLGGGITGTFVGVADDKKVAKRYSSRRAIDFLHDHNYRYEKQLDMKNRHIMGGGKRIQTAVGIGRCIRNHVYGSCSTQ